MQAMDNYELATGIIPQPESMEGVITEESDDLILDASIDSQQEKALLDVSFEHAAPVAKPNKPH